MRIRNEIEKLNNAIAGAIAGFRPPENITVSEWADMKRYISPEAAAEPGPWRTRRTPYLKEPMDAFTDPRVRRIVMVASSQVGKSEFELNAIGYCIDQDPGSILYIHPNLGEAKKFSKLRVAPMIRDSRTLRSKVAETKSRDSGNTILQKSFPGGMLTLCGSETASALASTPVRYVIGDERDRWAVSAGKEGDPWMLAQARQTTFYNAKAIEVSTPTIKGASAIETSFYEGTQERWCTKCPDCGGWHNIVYANIRFEKEEKKIRKKTYYEVGDVWWVCPGCGCCHDEKTMKKQPSRWVAENPDAYKKGVRSFWLNAFSSPWVSWKSIVLEMLEASGDTQKLKVVFNTKLGELWEDRGEMQTEDELMQRREEYTAELPDGVLVLTCGVDTQDNRLEYEIVGHGHFGEKWGIRRGVLMGRPDAPEVWEALDDVIDSEYSFASGIKLKISCTFVDSGGNKTQDVYTNCKARERKRVFAIKGRGGPDIPYTSLPKKTKIVIGGRYVGECWFYLLGVDSGKEQIMDSLKVQEAGPRYYHFPINPDLGYDAAYFEGLLSEKWTYRQGKKNPWGWEKIPGHERNEPLDMRNYANAAFRAIEPKLDRIEERLRQLREEQPQKRAPTQKQEQRRTQSAQPRGVQKYFDAW